MTFNHNYDAVHVFRRSFDELTRQLTAAQGKPRVQSAIRDQLYTIRVLFAAFINHALAVKFPDHHVADFDDSHAEEVLMKLAPTLLGRKQPVDLDRVWEMFDFNVDEETSPGLLAGKVVNWTLRRDADATNSRTHPHP